MYCRNCGSEVNVKAVVCPTCGVSPLSEKKFCQECGAETKENQMVCVKCGFKLLSRGSGSLIGRDMNLDISNLTASLGKQFNLLGVVFAGLMFFSIFLPWFGSGIFSVNALPGSYLGSNVPGIFQIIVSIVAIGLSFITFKWTFAIGILNFLLAWINLFNVNSSYWSWGGFVFMAFSIAYVVVNFKTFKEN